MTCNCKQLKSFIVRVSYVHKFILPLAELPEGFDKLLKKNIPFRWDKQAAFQKVKDVLSSL